MIRNVLLSVFAVFVLSIGVSVFAQSEKPIPEEFSKIDTNKDGKLDMKEFKAAFPGTPGDNTDERFKHADTNNDNFISPDELNAAHGTAPDKSKDKAKKTDGTKKQ